MIGGDGLGEYPEDRCRSSTGKGLGVVSNSELDSALQKWSCCWWTAPWRHGCCENSGGEREFRARERNRRKKKKKKEEEKSSDRMGKKQKKGKVKMRIFFYFKVIFLTK